VQSWRWQVLEEVLRILEDGNIRGYQDVETLCTRVGRPGTLEDGQLVAVEVRAAEEQMGTTDNDDDNDDDDVVSIDSASIDLMTKKRLKRDGTGQTRRALSWIWTSGTRSANPDDEGDNILQVEWAKSRARVGRCCEEVLLLKEEMRRIVAFLDWKAAWWMSRRNMRGGVGDAVRKDLQEGLSAYAEGQADLQKSLRKHFCALWGLPLGRHDDHGNQLEEDEDGDEEDADGEDEGEEDDDEAEGEDVYEEDEDDF
jgi:hypothetical protein